MTVFRQTLLGASCGIKIEHDGGWPHFDADGDLGRQLDAYGWCIADGRVLCENCDQPGDNGQEQPS